MEANDLKKEIPTREGALKALDPRTDEGLPLLATLLGVFAVLVFVFAVLNSMTMIINWNPLVWISMKVPFIGRTIMAVLTIIASAGGLIFMLSVVKVMHLLHRWRHKDDGAAA